MSNRFHNKFHRFNHSTTKDINIPDSGYDPIASHEFPFKGDFVQYPDGAVLSARNIATNTVIPFSGNIITFPYPYTVVISNLSAISATVNYQDILVSELSGFVINGLDNTLQIHPIQIEGVNNLTLKGTPISSTSWVSISGDFQTQSNMYVSGVAYIANEYVTNLTAVNLSALNANTYDLTTTNLSAYSANIYNLNVSNNSIMNHASANEIDIKGSYVRFYPNIDPLDNNYNQGLFLGTALNTGNPLNSASMIIAGSMALNDGWTIHGNTLGSDVSQLIIETYDNRDEPIIFRQIGLGIPYTMTQMDSTGMSVTGNMNVTNTVLATAADFTNLSANHIYPHTSNAVISAHGNLAMLGNSISGIGNASLSFQSGAKINSPSNGLQLSTNNSARMTITSAGNVGIGTTNPNEKLTVVGNISASGNIQANGDTIQFFPNLDGYGTPQGLFRLTISNSSSANMLVQGTMAFNDYWKIYGNTTAVDGGQLIIETGDNRQEPIIFQQYDGGTYTMARMDSTGMSVTGNMNVTDTVIATAANFTNLSANNIYPHTANATISAHTNLEMLGFSISNIGNISFIGATTYVGTVTATGQYLTCTVNGSAVKIPLYI